MTVPRLTWLPPPRSRAWLLVFGGGTFVLAGALIGAGALNRGSVTGEVVGNITAVSAMVAALLAALGWVGARLTVLGATVGLGLGYLQMVWAFTRNNDGFADLAAFAGFLMLTTLGFGAGLIADVVRWVMRRRAADDGDG